MPSLPFQRNTTSAVNSISRVGLGNYVVHFPGLGSTGGTVDVSPYGITSNACEVGFWGQSGTEEIVNVRCFTVNGIPADTRFTAAFVDAVAGGTVDYVWANQPSSASYTPDLTHQYNHNGSLNSITRTSPGVYHVRLPGDGGMQGDVKVTAYGLDAHTCSVIRNGVAAGPITRLGPGHWSVTLPKTHSVIGGGVPLRAC